MQRFPKNRWALILTLSAFVALGSLRAAIAEEDPTGSVGPFEPNAGGDPDVPDGRSNTTSKNGYPLKRWAADERHAGDMSAHRSDGVWRLIMVLKGLRLFVFRF